MGEKTLKKSIRNTYYSYTALLVILLFSLSSCYFSHHRKDGRDPKDNHDDKGVNELSPPTIIPPLYQCGTSVSVQGFVPGAVINIYTNGNTWIGGGVSDAPWGQKFSVNPALVAGQKITAKQTFDSVESLESKAEEVVDFFSTHPEGLPKPEIDTPLYDCGGAVGVRNLAEGGLLEVYADNNLVGDAQGCGAGQWLFVDPQFADNQSVYAVETLCNVEGPHSDDETVQPTPASLPKLVVGDVYEGGTRVVVDNIVNGAMVKVYNGNQQVAGHYCSGGGQIFRLDPMPNPGDSLTARQKLCNVESDPSDPSIVKPCSELSPPVVVEPIHAGDDFITVSGTVLDARIRVYAGANLIGDGGGPRVNLFQPLMGGENITVTQALGECTSDASKPVRVNYDLWSGLNNADIFDESDKIIDDMLDHMARANLRVLRVIIDLRLEMDENGNPLPEGSYDDCLLDEIDNLMVKLKKKGILLLITLQAYNWINESSLPVTDSFYSWRKCKIPVAVYNSLAPGETKEVYGPYYKRYTEQGHDYLTYGPAKDAYKARVSHILNHVNPYFGKPWKEMNDVVWAWGLQSEPEYIDGSTTPSLRDWFNEMATYVKGIDPDTYIALGTKKYNEDLGNIQDADIYTLHPYWSPEVLQENIDSFQDTIGKPFGKLLLVEEFNPFKRHTPGSYKHEKDFEKIMEVCRKNGIPWMFWEFDYLFNNFYPKDDFDDIWHANASNQDYNYPDGVFWGAKIVPGGKKIWETTWDWTTIGKTWNVQEKVVSLCAMPGVSCQEGYPIFFLDTFSSEPLDPDYHWFDEGNPDVKKVEDGYLEIEAGVWQDLWGGSPYKRGAPLLLYPAPGGDYQVETFVRVDPGTSSPQPKNTQMGLFVFQDVNNWIFFGLTNHDFDDIQGDGLIVTTTINNNSSIKIEKPLDEDFAFLKIERRGNKWSCYWKLQYDDSWEHLTTITVNLEAHEVGLGLKTLDVSPPNSGKANFDFFLIEERN